MKNKFGEVDVWEKEYVRFEGWNTLRQRRIQKKEARLIARWLIAQQLPHYDILEIGCGNGYVGICVIKILKEHAMSFSYHFTDLLPRCIERTRKQVCNAGMSENGLRFSVLDVYQAEQVLGAESQQIIISTGFASAATHKDAIPVVARILQKDGLLIADFVNNMSLSIFLTSVLRSIKRYKEYRRGIGKSYHFGILGVRDFFARYGLHLIEHRALRVRRNPIVCMFKKTII
ncbi:MAG: hypothetical protein AMXMBFR44_1170 [Candidatus Campbellbacteria bacterium]